MIAAHDATLALGLAPLSRWAAEWRTFKARARVFRLAGNLSGSVTVADEATSHFVAEAERHRALDFSPMRAVADADRSGTLAA